FSGLVPPTGTKVPSCSTRRSFTCIAGLMSATSSRKKVPPSATLKRPGLSRVAPVNEHGHVAGDELVEQPVEPAHRIALADDVCESVAALQLVLQVADALFALR